MGSGSWRGRPPAQCSAIEAGIQRVQDWGALFDEPNAGGLCRAVLADPADDGPGLPGVQSASSRAVVWLLQAAWPGVQIRVFDGHMGPITHPLPVNDAIEDFLGRVSSS